MIYNYHNLFIKNHSLLLIGWQLAGAMGKLQSDWLMIYNYHNLFIKNYSFGADWLAVGWCHG